MPSRPLPLLMMALTMVAACRQDPVSRVNEGVTSLEPSTALDTADATRVVTITAVVDQSIRPIPTSVAFTTTAGEFLPEGTSLTVAPDISGVARAQLRAPADEAVAFVTATTGRTTRATEIRFVSAPPTRIEVTTGSSALEAGAAHRVEVSATLLRAQGQPSAGALVSFFADTTRDAGTTGAVGTFSPPSVLARASLVTVQFSIADTSFRGAVRIRARAEREGVVVEDTTTLTVIEAR